MALYTKEQLTPMTEEQLHEILSTFSVEPQEGADHEGLIYQILDLQASTKPRRKRVAAKDTVKTTEVLAEAPKRKRGRPSKAELEARRLAEEKAQAEMKQAEMSAEEEDATLQPAAPRTRMCPISSPSKCRRCRSNNPKLQPSPPIRGTQSIQFKH